jgi:hypothetical protein
MSSIKAHPAVAVPHAIANSGSSLPDAALPNLPNGQML